MMAYFYEAATMSVQVQNQQTKPIPLHKGVTQGDVISLKMFTNAMFKTLSWKGRGININVNVYISHLRFVDDIGKKRIGTVPIRLVLGQIKIVILLII